MEAALRRGELADMTRRDRALHIASAASPALVVLLLAGPITAGLAGTLIPAFGYFPALGGNHFNLDGFRMLFAEPGIWMSVFLSLFTGIAATVLSLAIVDRRYCRRRRRQDVHMADTAHLAAARGAACGGGVRVSVSVFTVRISGRGSSRRS